jgi:hypothetical protein
MLKRRDLVRLSTLRRRAADGDHAIDTCSSTSAAVAQTILCVPCPAFDLVSTTTSPASRNASTSRLTALRSRFNRVAIAVIDAGSSFTALKTTMRARVRSRAKSSGSSNVTLNDSEIGSPRSAVRAIRLPCVKKSSAASSPTCNLAQNSVGADSQIGKPLPQEGAFGKTGRFPGQLFPASGETLFMRVLLPSGRFPTPSSRRASFSVSGCHFR